ncbi:MAG: ABC transporter ATP-binding protein/permease, partial [Clostridiales bacterium]|nr:ABC transporter ATP-binding protein/permease [Clostridiales bacterium]
ILEDIVAVYVQFMKGDVLNAAIGLNSDGLLKSAILLLTFILLEIAMMQVSYISENALLASTEKNLKHDILGSILNVNYADFRLSTVGDYVSKFTVMTPEIMSKYFSSLLLLINFCFKIASITIGLLVLGWQVTLLTLFLLSMPLYLPKLLEKKLQQLQNANVEKAEKYITSLTNVLQGLEVVKNFSIEHKLMRRMDAVNQSAISAKLQSMNCSSLMRGLTTIISYFSYFAIIAFSAYLVLIQKFNAGQFFVAVGMIDQLSYPLIALANCIQNIISTKQNRQSVIDFTASQLPEDGAAQSSSAVFSKELVFDKVRFKYSPEDSWLLDGCSLSVRKGEKCLIQGKSGAGKTTLINCMLRYYPVSEGSITIDGVSVNDIPGIFELCSVMRQDIYLFSETLRDNISLFDEKIDDKQIISAMQALGLSKYATPEGLDTYIGDGNTQLSGGEKRRIGIARVLLSSKSIVILDEPLANLDDNSKSLVKSFISTFKDKTVIVISHEWSITESEDSYFDNVLLLA